MKKNKLLVTVLLALLAVSAAGCLFSFAYVSWQELSRQNRLRTLQDFERQEKAARALDAEYREWQKLPGALRSFRRRHLLSMDEFAAFRRELDARLAANGLRAPRIDLSFGGSRNGMRKVLVKFSLEGSYRELKKFIFAMEAKAKMYFFGSLQLSASAGKVKGAFTMEVVLGE
jgi:Tfp pilus assembly protein PilO